jgi:hypothetical protein
MTSRYHRDFIRALNEAAVEFLVVGGQAAIYHGVHRNTGDLDLLLRATPQNGRHLKSAFLKLGLQADDVAAEDFAGEVFLAIGFEPDAVDLFTKSPGLDFDKAFKRASLVSETGLSYRLISIEDLIRNKQHLKRTGEKGKLDEHDVLALKRILRSRKKN